MFSLQAKVAIVTGAGSGIGAAIAERFAAAGANVFVADRDAVGGAATVQRITGAHGKATFMELDVTNEPACTATVARVISDAARVDVLVNNAGVGMVGTILNTSSEDLDRLWAVNVKSMFYLCKAALPHMIERRAGSIINIGSIASVIGMYDRFAYTTTKHAVAGMTRAMALDHGTTGVRINCICPGRVETPFVQGLLREYPDPEKYRAQFSAPHALKRMAQPEEIAAAAHYLASDDSSFVTGSEFLIDGGYSAGK